MVPLHKDPPEKIDIFVFSSGEKTRKGFIIMLNFLIASGTLDMLPENTASLHLLVTPDCVAPLALIAGKVDKVEVIETTRAAALALNVFDIAKKEKDYNIMIYTNDETVAADFKALSFTYDGVEYKADSNLLSKKPAKKTSVKKTAAKTTAVTAEADKPASTRTRKPRAKKTVTPPEETTAEKVKKAMNMPEEDIVIDEEPGIMPPPVETREEQIRKIVIDAVKNSSDKSIGMPIVLSTSLAAAGFDDPEGKILADARKNYDYYKTLEE